MVDRIGQKFIAGFMALLFTVAAAKATSESATPVYYRTVTVDGLSIFYREAGPANAPTLLLFHGFPSSSRIYEPLFARLATQFHLIAPEYPGFGHSDAPDPKAFTYTFDHIADVIEHVTDTIGATHYATPSISRIMAARSGFAWRSRTQSASAD